MTDLEQAYSRLERYLVELHAAHAALTANTGDPLQRVIYVYFLDAVTRVERAIDQHAPPGARGRAQ